MNSPTTLRPLLEYCLLADLTTGETYLSMKYLGRPHIEAAWGGVGGGAAEGRLMEAPEAVRAAGGCLGAQPGHHHLAALHDVPVREGVARAPAGRPPHIQPPARRIVLTAHHLRASRVHQL